MDVRIELVQKLFKEFQYSKRFSGHVTFHVPTLVTYLHRQVRRLPRLI